MYKGHGWEDSGCTGMQGRYVYIQFGAGEGVQWLGFLALQGFKVLCSEAFIIYAQITNYVQEGFLTLIRIETERIAQ